MPNVQLIIIFFMFNDRPGILCAQVKNKLMESNLINVILYNVLKYICSTSIENISKTYFLS